MYTSLSITWVLQHCTVATRYTTHCVFYLAVIIFLVACSDEGKLGTADAAAEATGNENAADLNQKDKKRYDTQHNCCSSVGSDEGLNGRDASSSM